ncbi:polysaccharide deacetylase family protein [Parvularcula lutaonensis]|uniref:Chitooligosaccharide deacetylase n=1 Tax=Parvularcula lutaonensis TaxID=491923 RepID=A0ABV7MCA6_9PROT|nr:polysaccharide deacetylase family protein [Parvularcula lutaonensis]GGY38593.1 polysaccharide deacetylase [Parvularcula lutaonensis]
MKLPRDPAPQDFTWPGGKRLALSIVVNVEEGAESRIDEGDRGPEPVDELGVTLKKPIRMYGNETNYQYGINRGAPRVLKLLDEAGVNATWTACGLALEKAPWLAEAIVARGDEPCNHGYKWAFTAFMNEEAEAEFIRKGTESIEKTCGRKPAGWLSRYLHSDATRRLLKEQGYFYHMDDYSDDFPFWDQVEMKDGHHEPMVILPYAIDSNDMKFWLDPSFTPNMWLDYATRTFDWLRTEAAEEGARMMSIGLHLRIIGRPGRIAALRDFLSYVTGHDDVWITTREAIARHFAENVQPG